MLVILNRKGLVARLIYMTRSLGLVVRMPAHGGCLS